MPLTRQELFTRLGIIRLVDPLVDRIYREEEQHIWEKDLGNAPHGHPWHTSFHASSFPGDDPKACARAALYGLMNIPKPEPTTRWLRGLGDAGKNIESELVQRFAKAGILLSADDGDEFQTGFVDPETWLTGNCDAIIKPPGWNRGHVLEIKSKSEEKINHMKQGIRKWDDAHRNQILTYIGFAHIFSKWMWPELERVKDGTLYYVSRDDPANTFEFQFDYDAKFIEEGKGKLKDWRQAFIDGELPERPKGWRWTEQPCKWCSVKKLCKADHKEKVTALADSNAISYAEKVRSYDYTETRAAVLARWNGGS